MIELVVGPDREPLSVRRFAVKEGLSAFFTAEVTAVSPRADLDMDTLVGQPATLSIPRAADACAFEGVVRRMALARVEPGGLSTYEIHLAHPLWLLSQRTNHRVFQQLSIPRILDVLLAEWGLAATWHIDEAAHAPLDYRVQHGETDLAFFHRLIEEAGLSYRPAPTSEGAAAKALAITDAPEHAEPRAAPVPFLDTVSPTESDPHVTEVRLVHEVRPARAVLRDYDFRRPVDHDLSGAAQTAGDVRLESYRYRPGALTSDMGPPRTEARLAAAAKLQLATERGHGRAVTFATNVLSLAPGAVFAIAAHPHPALSASSHLLVTERSIEGAHAGAVQIVCRAVPASEPFAPPRLTPKPSIDGVESAIVVGPAGRPIHTDEHGRVRVQFRWDRRSEGENSSCWIRVSQGWAGPGYGLFTIPRVGDEVLVAFQGGDPDQPVIVGRLFNGPSPTPHKLPEHATRSTWKSATVPGGEGGNELFFEDAKGRELVYLQAERDLEEQVKADARMTVGRHREKRIGLTDTEVIGGEQTTTVGANRTATIVGVDSTTVGLKHEVTVPATEPGAMPTSAEIAHRKITLTTGQATITLEGPNITLDAAASILLSAAAQITVTGRANIQVMSGAEVRIESSGGDVVLQGAPLVHINPERRGVVQSGSLDWPVEVPPEVDIEDHLDEVEDRRTFDADAPHWFQDQTGPGGEWDPHRWGPGFEEFGFFHLGLLGRAAGLPAGALLRLAGRRHLAGAGAKSSAALGDPGNGLFGGRAPYGNDPKHLAALRKGISHFEERLS
ncbi:MAG: type VI secretion system tip protein TssI/VgrG [Polyangiaceae bacterium]